MKKYTEPFYPETFYTVYNSGNNRDRLFYSSKNYECFLEKYEEYISEIVETYAFSLIPDQFYILIKTPFNVEIISNQFRKFFISYSNSINIQENRIGSLFLKPFRRKPIVGKNLLLAEIFNIHYKPVQFGIYKSYEDYYWSSYKSILSNLKTKICRKEVLKLFGNENYFIQFHKDMLDYGNENIKLVNMGSDLSFKNSRWKF
jgi:putative transposase